MSIYKARKIAERYQGGQKDKAGHSYLEAHVETVAETVELAHGSEAQVAAAWLHDVIEDTACTLQNLRDEGIPESVIELVDALSRRDGETYKEFIARIKTVPDAILIKMADIHSNLDPARLYYLPADEQKYLRIKYASAIIQLEED